MPPKSGDSLIQQALILGKNRNYWHNMKRQAIDKYEYISSIGECDLIEGYRLYVIELDTVLNKFSELYSDLEYARMVTAFSEEYEYNKSSVAHRANRTVKGIKSHRTLIVMKKMIPQMEYFLKEGNSNE